MNLLSRWLIKISGHELDDDAFLQQLAVVIKQIQHSVVIVHGGGKEITALQEKMKIQPKYVDGIRVTDAESLQLVEMVLCGSVNKRLVRTLYQAGIDAIGLSGVDRGMVRAQKMVHPTQDMGFTGEVVTVRSQVLFDILSQRTIPVIAPICYGEESNLNVNADHVAGAIAAEIDADRLIFLSNVEGVLQDGNLLPALQKADIRTLIENGTIFGGMIPKVNTALHALESGVKNVVITNLVGLLSHGGTVISQ